jgi:hypothetical protein
MDKLFKTPNSANIAVEALIAAGLDPFAEILNPRIAVIDLRRTPIDEISKTANHI